MIYISCSNAQCPMSKCLTQYHKVLPKWRKVWLLYKRWFIWNVRTIMLYLCKVKTPVLYGQNALSHSEGSRAPQVLSELSAMRSVS